MRRANTAKDKPETTMTRFFIAGIAALLMSTSAHSQDAAQNFGFDVCLYVDGKAPGPGYNCAVITGSKSLAECEEARKLAKQRGLTTTVCREIPLKGQRI
jgi:hypothetical protein